MSHFYAFMELKDKILLCPIGIQSFFLSGTTWKCWRISWNNTRVVIPAHSSIPTICANLYKGMVGLKDNKEFKGRRD